MTLSVWNDWERKQTAYILLLSGRNDWERKQTAYTFFLLANARSASAFTDSMMGDFLRAHHMQDKEPAFRLTLFIFLLKAHTPLTTFLLRNHTLACLNYKNAVTTILRPFKRIERRAGQRC